jgi:hypothetical protein
MSRLSTGNVQYVKPTSNVYTVLAAIALVAVIIGLVVLIMRADTLFKPLPGPGSSPTTPGLFG